MLSGPDGSPGRSTPAIRSAGQSIPPQQDLALLAENAFLRQQNTEQNERIEDLENRLKKYENAHTPSSKQGSAGQQPPQNDESEQEEENDEVGGDSDAASDSSPGRNTGHDGTTQPPPDTDRTVWVGETYCPNCDRVLTDPDEYVSRVIVDIPLPVPTEVTKYELGKQECCCGNEVVAEHPDCSETGRFGPHLLAQTALLRYHGRLPHQKQAELFDWQLDHPVSPGTIYNMTERVADLVTKRSFAYRLIAICRLWAWKRELFFLLYPELPSLTRLRPAYEDVRASVRDSDVIYCDETSFSVDGEQHWVWTSVTDKNIFYTIDESRGSQVLEDVLGDELAKDATLSCDGWSAYPSYHGKLQRCWAHLLREAKYVAERHEEAEPISEILHDLHEDQTAFDEGDPPASAREWRRAQASLCLEELIKADYETEEVTQLAEKIRSGLSCWLTFVTEPEVDSTNNRAERALREQVVMRKIFGGLRSETGVRIHETVSTMVAMWERQGLNPPDQSMSVLGGKRPDARAEASTTELR